jgi:Flp pilus assembly pilin Flp
MQLLWAFWRDERGVTTVEYAVVAALVTVTLATVVGPLVIGFIDLYSQLASAKPQP